jgi:virginiamycin B lyase
VDAPPDAFYCGRLNVTGTITEFSTGLNGTQPLSIASGRDAKLWFTEETGNKIGRVQ